MPPSDGLSPVHPGLFSGWAFLGWMATFQSVLGLQPWAGFMETKRYKLPRPVEEVPSTRPTTHFIRVGNGFITGWIREDGRFVRANEIYLLSRTDGKGEETLFQAEAGRAGVMYSYQDLEKIALE